MKFTVVGGIGERLKMQKTKAAANSKQQPAVLTSLKEGKLDEWMQQNKIYEPDNWQDPYQNYLTFSGRESDNPASTLFDISENKDGSEFKDLFDLSVEMGSDLYKLSPSQFTEQSGKFIVESMVYNLEKEHEARQRAMQTEQAKLNKAKQQQNLEKRRLEHQDELQKQLKEDHEAKKLEAKELLDNNPKLQKPIKIKNRAKYIQQLNRSVDSEKLSRKIRSHQQAEQAQLSKESKSLRKAKAKEAYSHILSANDGHPGVNVVEYKKA